MTTWFGARGLCGAVAAALFLGLAHPALAADQPQWVRQLGTPDYDQASGVATDGDGNVYIAGYIDRRFEADAWVAKYSAAGALVWKRQLATPDGDYLTGVATDGDDNVYVSGYTWVFDQDVADPWLAKYSAAGALRWKRQLGTAESDYAWDVATDGDGSVYIAGSTGSREGEVDAWVAKYSTAGALRWRRQLATAGDDNLSGVATDADGDVYIAGYISTLQGSVNAWIAKYSAAGALRWKRQLGTRNVQAFGVATDGDNNVYAAGRTFDSLGGPNQGSDDAWVAKYSSTGRIALEAATRNIRDGQRQ